MPTSSSARQKYGMKKTKMSKSMHKMAGGHMMKDSETKKKPKNK